MTIFRQREITKGLLRRPVLAIGNFDGVHLGHRRILQRVLEQARERGAPSAVLTFEPHPVKVINPAKNLKLIFPYQERYRLLDEVGVENILIWDFTYQVAATPAEEFVAEALVELLDVGKIVVGYNFNFGKAAEGSPDQLARIAAERGYPYEVETIGAFEVGGEKVSSSRIREYIVVGDAARVRSMLGRPFYLHGTVVRGRDRGGKLLGYPTANLSVQNELIPGQGVYVGRARVRDRFHRAMINIGDNPTFNEVELSVEAHLLDFSDDIYGEDIELHFLERIRDEMRFSSAQELVGQMDRDREVARSYFDRNPEVP